jgi:hypothetical protein
MEELHPVAVKHLPPFVTPPGQTDILFVVMTVFLIGIVLIIGNLAGLRYERWKMVFLEQREEGLAVWQNPLIPLRFPKLFDIKGDRFERAQTDAGEYDRWRVEHAFALVPAQAYIAKHLQTYVAFPPRQSPAASRSTRSWRNCRRVADTESSL